MGTSIINAGAYYLTLLLSIAKCQLWQVLPRIIPDMNATIPILNIEFGKSLTGDTFDVVVSEDLKRKNVNKLAPAIVIFDFRELRFIDIGTSIQIMSFAKRCQVSHWYLTIKLPMSNEVLDFWKVWGFIHTFEKAVGVQLARYLSEADQKRLDEPQRTFSPFVTKIHQHTERLRSKAVFGFNCEEIRNEKSPGLADHITNQWRRREVQDALEHHFGDEREYLAPRVIFETIYNATKHANARVLVTASFHDRLCSKQDRKKWSRDDLFTLAIWDDGSSLVSTLQDAIETGIDVREDLSVDFEQEYLMNCHELYSSPKYFTEKVQSDMELSVDISLELLLLATLFPGTTSKPASEHQSRIIDDETLTKRGLGLYTLLNSAIDVLGGTVSFRTANFFMHVRKPNERDLLEHGVELDEYNQSPEKYKKVKVVRNPEQLPEFMGNLILVRA